MKRLRVLLFLMCCLSACATQTHKSATEIKGNTLTYASPSLIIKVDPKFQYGSADETNSGEVDVHGLRLLSTYNKSHTFLLINDKKLEGYLRITIKQAAGNFTTGDLFIESGGFGDGESHIGGKKFFYTTRTVPIMRSSELAKRAAKAGIKVPMSFLVRDFIRVSGGSGNFMIMISYGEDSSRCKISWAQKALPNPTEFQLTLLKAFEKRALSSFEIMSQQ